MDARTRLTDWIRYWLTDPNRPPPERETAQNAQNAQTVPLEDDAWAGFVEHVDRPRRDDPMLRVGAVADILGVHPNTARAWIEAGRIAGERAPGGHWRVRRSAVEAYRDAMANRH